ncbi:MAG: FHA domain-containing protein, partial [Myxococcota bacterium]|nr:FHA domain-containing protein [Myxococcota bacterium]
MGRLIYYDSTGREITIPFGPEQPLVTIGRATDCTIQSNRKSVSRHHAEFRFNNGQYEIVDLNSSNGTYLIVNESRQPVKPRAALSHLDEVWCGDFMLQFEEIDEYLDPGFLEPDSDPTYGDGAPIMVNQPYNTSPPQGGGYDQGYNNGGYDQGYDQGYNNPNNSGFGQQGQGYEQQGYNNPNNSG